MTTARTSASKLWIECSFSVSVETLVTQSKLFVLSTSDFRSKSGDIGTNCACGCDREGMVLAAKERGLDGYESFYFLVSERIIGQMLTISKPVVEWHKCMRKVGEWCIVKVRTL